METNQKILLFDGVCNLCNRLVKFIIRNDPDSKIKFVPLKSDQGAKLLVYHPETHDGTDSVVYLSGDKVYLRSSAVINLLKDLGGAWSLFYLFIVVPPFIRDRIYNFIAANRFRLSGKSDTCQVTDH